MTALSITVTTCSSQICPVRKRVHRCPCGRQQADATAHGGHLFEGHVRPTLEPVITDTPSHLHRRFDPESALNLISPLNRTPR